MFLELQAKLSDLQTRLNKLNSRHTTQEKYLDEHFDNRLGNYLDNRLANCIDSYRVFHGRGHCYSGLEMLTVDYFEPVLLITLFELSAHETEILRVIETAVASLKPKLKAVVVQRRYIEGAPLSVLQGVLPDSVYARRGPLRFILKLGQRQNSGFFLDIEPGRQWLQDLCVDISSKSTDPLKVLNLFSYTCAFSVVAVAAGAAHVVNVDMSSAALSLGRENHQLNRLPKAASRFLSENIMKSWGRIKRPGPYDIAIIDPPSFQPGSFISVKDYIKVVRRIPQFMQAGGHILACLNAPELDCEFLLKVFSESCPECIFVGRLEPNLDFPDVDAQRQLKLLHFQYQPSEPTW